MEVVAGHSLIAVRVLGVMLTAPLFAGSHLSWLTRLLIAATVTMAVMLNHPVPTVAEIGADYFRLLLGELLLGVFIGGGVSLLFSTAGVAGGMLARMMGLQWSTENAENAGDQEATSRLLWGISLGIYLLAQGPERLLLAVSDSLFNIPVGSQILASRSVEPLMMLLSQTSWLALRGIGPAVAAYFMSVLLLGAVAKVLPQFNLFLSGMNVNMLLFWVSLMLVACGGTALMHDEIWQWLSELRIASPASIAAN